MSLVEKKIHTNAHTIVNSQWGISQDSHQHPGENRKWNIITISPWSKRIRKKRYVSSLSPQRWTKISTEFYFTQVNEIERAIVTQYTTYGWTNLIVTCDYVICLRAILPDSIFPLKISKHRADPTPNTWCTETRDKCNNFRMLSRRPWQSLAAPSLGTDHIGSMNYDLSFVVTTITVTCYSWAPPSGGQLFTCGSIYTSSSVPD